MASDEELDSKLTEVEKLSKLAQTEATRRTQIEIVTKFLRAIAVPVLRGQLFGEDTEAEIVKVYEHFEDDELDELIKAFDQVHMQVCSTWESLRNYRASVTGQPAESTLIEQLRAIFGPDIVVLDAAPNQQLNFNPGDN